MQMVMVALLPIHQYLFMDYHQFIPQPASKVDFIRCCAFLAQVVMIDPYIINTAYILTPVLSMKSCGATELSETIYDKTWKPERKELLGGWSDWRFLTNRIGTDATYYKENTTPDYEDICS